MSRKYTETVSIVLTPEQVAQLSKLKGPKKLSAHLRGVVDAYLIKQKNATTDPVQRLSNAFAQHAVAVEELNAAYAAVMEAANAPEEAASPPADRPAFHCDNLVDDAGLCATCGDVTVLHT